MKRNILCCLLLSFIAMAFFSCSKSPEEYFGAAVLNTNILYGFADNGFSRQLESPSVMLPDNGGEPVPMKRTEVINTKIKQVEENLYKVESMKVNDETKNMLEASIILHKYVLPVYKTEYFQLAELYDNGASADQIEILTNSIHDKYSAHYKELYDRLISEGKIYAAKNNIQVKWDVKPSP